MLPYACVSRWEPWVLLYNTWNWHSQLYLCSVPLLFNKILHCYSRIGCLYSPLCRAYIIEIIDIECELLSRVSQKIVATKWRIYKGKISSPQDILCKNKRYFLKKIQSDGFIRAICFVKLDLCHVTGRAFYI